MPENWLANAAITDMQMRQRDVAALDAKYTKELADAKAGVDVCVMMLPLVVVGCIGSLSVSAKPPPPPAWIMPFPRLADTAERDYFTLRERLGSLVQKQLEGTQKYINEQADRVAHIDGQLIIIVSIHIMRFQREYKCLK